MQAHRMICRDIVAPYICLQQCHEVVVTLSDEFSFDTDLKLSRHYVDCRDIVS